MSRHLARDLDRLKEQLLRTGVLVEEAINRATSAFLESRPAEAQDVICGDGVINAREVETEEQCLKILALHQPVAVDLRFIVTAMKVNNDLERMGDLAVNIAERAESLSGPDALPVPSEIPEMVMLVRNMVRRSLDSLVNLDPDLAREVLAEDDRVDDLNRRVFAVLQESMKENPRAVPPGITYLSVSRNLERVADLATNIAEDVIFLVEGEVVRHRH